MHSVEKHPSANVRNFNALVGADIFVRCSCHLVQKGCVASCWPNSVILAGHKVGASAPASCSPIHLDSAFA